jgi:16S rRNA (cytidine1402-2'-O)-methyltransferase
MATLYIVATPIGNLEDLSQRAIRILRDCPVIVAEDTRHTGTLLKHLGIENKKFISLYDEVEEQKSYEIIELLKEGSDCALVSDAGTPLVADPG